MAENQQDTTQNEPKQNSGKKSQSILVGGIIAAVVIVLGGLYFSAKIVMDKAGGSPSKVLGQQAISEQAALGQSANPATTVSERKGEAVLGSADAKVTIVEFSDFQCPYCEKFISQTFPEIKSKYIDTGKVKLVFKHYPLPFHSNAQKAAEAAECANRQGKFWAYHDLLFKNGQSDGTGLAVNDLKKYAKNLGLNTNKFNTCLDKGEAADAVLQDQKDASAAGITGTPSFLVNGKLVVGAQSFAVFSQEIEGALNK